MQLARSVEKKALIVCYSVLVFLAAYLLFEVEPLTGKIVSPLLGGTSAVWIVCLLFFQVAVLFGYLLTYSLAQLPARFQISVYTMLLVLSLGWAKIPAAAGWVFNYTNDPTWSLFSQLMSHLFIPCIILSSISGTMQVWHSYTGASYPYQLYSLSNLGSFGALLTYPSLIEPLMPVSTTLRVWWLSYLVLSSTAVSTAILVWHNKIANVAGRPQESGTLIKLKNISNKQIANWIFLSTLGSVALLAFSNYIITDIAPVPLLWTIPLALYLLAFVIAFAYPNLKINILLYIWFPMLVLEPFCAITFRSALLDTAVSLLMLFLLCLITTIELVKHRPDKEHLPLFYLAIAFGGALGGILGALVFPWQFSVIVGRYVITAVFTTYQLFAPPISDNKLKALLRTISIALLVILFVLFNPPRPGLLFEQRNFFGSVYVQKTKDTMLLIHGRILHGRQYLDPARRKIDAYQYGPPAALVFAFMHFTHGSTPIKVAVVGLGTGSNAAEMRAGDEIDFFEIDPKIISIAQHWFSYLSDSPARSTVSLGDGRLLLRNSHKQYDVICIDAFNGDAVPAHLLTLEAIKIYLEHLKPDGLLIFHLTNRSLDLPSVVGNAAKALSLPDCQLRYQAAVTYAVIAKEPNIMDSFDSYAKSNGEKHFATKVLDLPVRPGLRVWTDDYSNLFNTLKWRL